MRIGIIAPELGAGPGGMQEFPRQVARHLADTDDVVLFAVPGAPAPAPAIAMRAVPHRDLALLPERLDAEPVDVWFACNAALATIAPQLRAPTVVYLNGKDFLAPWIGVARPWITWIAGLRGAWRLADPLRTRVWRRDIRRGSHSVARLLANSAYTAALAARALRVPRARIGILHPGVADEFFRHGKSPRPSAPLRILTVARLARWSLRKNVDGLIRAVALLPPGIVETCDVVGDGDDRPRLEALAHSLHLDGRVRFLGSVSREDLLARYAEADLFVLVPTQGGGDVEGFGMVYVEAAAAGVPSIAALHSGGSDAVADGVSGLLLSSTQPAAIASAIRRVRAAPQQFSPEQVRAHAERFRWPRIVSALRAELLAVAAARPAGDMLHARHISSAGRTVDGR